MAYESEFVIRYLGLSYNWSNQIHSIESFKRIVKQRLRDQFIQEWQSRLAENSVCCKYSFFFKTNKQQQQQQQQQQHCFVEYLNSLPSALRQRVLKFWLSNHRRSLGISRDERICTVCDSGEVGDEFQYLLNCSNENVKRNRLSMLINIIHIIPTCPNSVASWIWFKI